MLSTKFYLNQIISDLERKIKLLDDGDNSPIGPFWKGQIYAFEECIRLVRIQIKESEREKELNESLDRSLHLMDKMIDTLNNKNS